MTKKGIKMNKIKTFKMEQNFSGTDGLYKYLLNNVGAVAEMIGLEIEQPLKETPYCLVGKEKITERNILFFASKSEYLESLGELIILAGALDADIIVFFLPKINNAHLESLSWLQKISNSDTQFIFGEADF